MQSAEDGVWQDLVVYRETKEQFSKGLAISDDHAIILKLLTVVSHTYVLYNINNNKTNNNKYENNENLILSNN